MMKLYRVSKGIKATRGVLVGNEGDPLCVTLENPWLDNTKNVSCIPTGVYLCQVVESPKYGKVYGITDVEGRGNILFHIGNYEHNTQGCILLGTKFGEKDGEPAIWESGIAMDIFNGYLNNEPFILNIIDVSNILY